MTFCKHIMRTDEIDEPRAYKRVWLAKCLRCEVRDLVCSEMFECVECHVFIHRRCWQSAACPKSTCLAVALEGPRRPTPPAARPERSVTATDRDAELRTPPFELPERSVIAADREAEPRRAKSSRDIGTNTSCQLDFGEPVVAEKSSDGCQAEEPTFSPSDILRKIREAKRSRSSFIPGNIPAHYSNEFVDLLGHPVNRRTGEPTLQCVSEDGGGGDEVEIRVVSTGV